MFYMIFTDMNKWKYATSACFRSFLNVNVAGNINIFVVTLRCIVQQLRISATISAPISALHAVISHRQTGQIQR